jgi:hypothetical protein
MGTTYLRAVTSLDGYIADERDVVGPLRDWYFNATSPSSTKTTPMSTVRHSGSQRPCPTAPRISAGRRAPQVPVGDRVDVAGSTTHAAQRITLTDNSSSTRTPFGQFAVRWFPGAWVVESLSTGTARSSRGPTDGAYGCPARGIVQRDGRDEHLVDELGRTGVPVGDRLTGGRTGAAVRLSSAQGGGV